MVGGSSLRVRTKFLEEGCILAQDIICMTNNPIMLKKTVITRDLLEVLRAFLVPEVSVEKNLIDGKPFVPKEVIDEEQEVSMATTSFSSHYLTAVQTYKRLFKNVQAGSPLDITKVRGFLLPLLDKALENSSEIFQIHHYSTKAEYLYHHAVSVAILSGFIGKKMNLDKGDIVQVALAGCLSDIGMAKISPNILDKKTGLTFTEFEEIRRHPEYGFSMIQKTGNTMVKDTVKIAILQHHERINGTGYPRGNKGQSLHLFSKIVAVADVYHAMTSERVYRKKHSPFKVLEMIMQDDFGKFDLQVINALMSGILNFSIGNRVKLSNGYIGEILFIDSNYPTRPLINIKDNNEIIHLEKRRDLFIEEVY